MAKKKKEGLDREFILSELYRTICKAREHIFTIDAETGEEELCEKKSAVYFKALELGAKLLSADNGEETDSTLKLVISSELEKYAN